MLAQWKLFFCLFHRGEAYSSGVGPEDRTGVQFLSSEIQRTFHQDADYLTGVLGMKWVMCDWLFM